MEPERKEDIANLIGALTSGQRQVLAEMSSEWRDSARQSIANALVRKELAEIGGSPFKWRLTDLGLAAQDYLSKSDK